MSITPSGMVYTVRSGIVKVEQRSPGHWRCNLMNILLANSDEYVTIPCFSCSGFKFTDDYYVHCEDRLTAALLFAVDGIYYRCARKIAKEVVQGNIFVANMTDVDNRSCPDAIITTVLVTIFVFPRQVYRVDDTTPVPVPQMKPAKLEVLMQMVDDKEGDRLGNGWVPAEHRCTVCMEEIERPWFSLTMPTCRHVFHEKCLVRWLYSSNVCPLCRIALPTETD